MPLTNWKRELMDREPESTAIAWPPEPLIGYASDLDPEFPDREAEAQRICSRATAAAAGPSERERLYRVLWYWQLAALFFAMLSLALSAPLLQGLWAWIDGGAR